MIRTGALSHAHSQSAEALLHLRDSEAFPSDCDDRRYVMQISHHALKKWARTCTRHVHVHLHPPFHRSSLLQELVSYYVHNMYSLLSNLTYILFAGQFSYKQRVIHKELRYIYIIPIHIPTYNYTLLNCTAYMYICMEICVYTCTCIAH